MLSVGAVFLVLALKAKALGSCKALVGHGHRRINYVVLVFVQYNHIGKRIEDFILGATLFIWNGAFEAPILVGGIGDLVVALRRLSLWIGILKLNFSFLKVSGVNHLIGELFREYRQTIRTLSCLLARIKHHLRSPTGKGVALTCVRHRQGHFIRFGAFYHVKDELL